MIVILCCMYLRIEVRAYVTYCVLWRRSVVDEDVYTSCVEIMGRGGTICTRYMKDRRNMA